MEKIVSDWYDSYYQKVNLTGKAASFSANKIHKLIESGRRNGNYAKCLEVGTNNMSHIPFVHHSWDKYSLVDLRPKEENEASGDVILSAISYSQADIHSLPFQDDIFHRGIATCLFHHLDDPLKAMRELKRVVQPNGVIELFLPCNPGLLYRTIRVLTTGLTAKKHGVSTESKYLKAIEHRNHVESLILMAKFTYGPENLHVEWFPFKLPSWNFNISCVIRIKNVKRAEK